MIIESEAADAWTRLRTDIDELNSNGTEPPVYRAALALPLTQGGITAIVGVITEYPSGFTFYLQNTGGAGETFLVVAVDGVWRVWQQGIPFITLPLPIADGGTGASTAPVARANLGLGTISTQDASNVAITGGSVTALAALSSGGLARFYGAYVEASTNNGIHAGFLNTTPRIGFFNGTAAQNWQVDNFVGEFRWFLPGVVHMSLTSTTLTLPTKTVIVSTTAAQVGIRTNLAPGQTADALQIANSSGTVLMDVDAAGVVQAAGYKSSDGSTGWTGTFTSGGGATVTVKNGIITNVA